MNDLYINNRLIISYEDLLKCLRQIKASPVSSTNAIEDVLESFYGGTLIEWLERTTTENADNLITKLSSLFKEWNKNGKNWKEAEAFSRLLSCFELSEGFSFKFSDYLEVESVRTIYNGREFDASENLLLNALYEADECFQYKFQLKVKQNIQKTFAIYVDSPLQDINDTIEIDISNYKVGKKIECFSKKYTCVNKIKRAKEGICSVDFKDDINGEILGKSKIEIYKKWDDVFPVVYIGCELCSEIKSISERNGFIQLFCHENDVDDIKLRYKFEAKDNRESNIFINSYCAKSDELCKEQTLRIPKNSLGKTFYVEHIFTKENLRDLEGRYCIHLLPYAHGCDNNGLLLYRFGKIHTIDIPKSTFDIGQEEYGLSKEVLEALRELKFVYMCTEKQDYYISQSQLMYNSTDYIIRSHNEIDNLITSFEKVIEMSLSLPSKDELVQNVKFLARGLSYEYTKDKDSIIKIKNEETKIIIQNESIGRNQQCPWAGFRLVIKSSGKMFDVNDDVADDNDRKVYSEYKRGWLEPNRTQHQDSLDTHDDYYFDYVVMSPSF